MGFFFISGICLGAMDDDKYSYMPSSSYSANITEPTKATKSDGTIKQTFTLSKNVYQDYTVSTRQEEPKWLFGKCKPGEVLTLVLILNKYLNVLFSVVRVFLYHDQMNITCNTVRYSFYAKI